MTYYRGTLLGPGQVKHPGSGLTHLGELSGGLTPRVEAVAAMFRAAGIETAVTDRTLDEIWKKLGPNASTLPTSALLGFFAHELVAFDGAKQAMAVILREVVDVTVASGIAPAYDERRAAITGLLQKTVSGKASMLHDVQAARKTEIEVINGAIVAAGKKAGVATPVNQRQWCR